MLCRQVAEELRSKVVEATGGLTCSVGVAPNMMLAKIASDRNKPNGQCAVAATREAVLDFIADLPIRKVGGE
jgi:DNA polymerase kappa